MEIRPYKDSDRAGLLALWTEIFPAGSAHNDPATSLDKKLRIDPELLLVSVKDDVVVGSVMGGYDGHRGWIYSLAVTPSLRRQGIASALMREIEEKLRERGCLKVNLQVVASNKEVVALYEELGFSVEERISMGKKLYE
jgi:ribosomal protein S18 acetylase RimI-like enzyme